MNSIEIIENRSIQDEIHIYTDNIYEEERPKDKLKIDINCNDVDAICSVDIFNYLAGCRNTPCFFLYDNFLTLVKSTINRKLRKYKYIVYDDEDNIKFEMESYFLSKRETVAVITEYRKKYSDNGELTLLEEV